MKKLILPIIALFFSATIFAQTAGILTVTYSTKAFSASQNTTVYTIYITNSTGTTLVNTLAFRASNNNTVPTLTPWRTLIGSLNSISTTSIPSSVLYVGSVDGISGATITTWYTGQKVYWGRTNSVASVADGSYKVTFIIEEYTGQGNSLQKSTYSGTFVKGSAASSPTVTASLDFYNLSVAWVPATSTGINDVEKDKLYSLYPNPAVSSIYVSGLDIESIDICSLSAKILLHSNEQNVNISRLPKGVYLAVVYTKSSGLVVKKFQKM